MNTQAVKVIYKYEMLRAWDTILQSFASPVISTILYFVVFGSAIGSRIENIEGITYGAFYFPRFTGTMYETLSAPISFIEIVLGYVGAAATKSFIIGLIILITAGFFVDLKIVHPFWMLSFLVLTCISFSLLGFIIGLWAESFEQLQLIPLLVITPLVFLGGSFYTIDMLPPAWQTISLFNPVVYLVSGFRWSFYEVSDVSIQLSLFMVLLFSAICLAIVWWMFKSGYRLKR